MSRFPRRGTSMFGTSSKGIIPVFGPQGPNGQQGQQGQQGIKGLQGQPGPQGPQGTSGVSGLSFYFTDNNTLIQYPVLNPSLGTIPSKDKITYTFTTQQSILLSEGSFQVFIYANSATTLGSILSIKQIYVLDLGTNDFQNIPIVSSNIVTISNTTKELYTINGVFSGTYNIPKNSTVHIVIDNKGEDEIVIYYQDSDSMSSINFFAPILISGPQGPKGDFGPAGYPGLNGNDGLA